MAGAVDLARDLARRGHKAAALDLAAQIAIRTPEDGWALALIGELAYAHRPLERAIALLGDRPEFLTGLALLKSGEEALADLHKALALAPDFVPALTNHGLWYQNQGRPFEGLPSLAKAVILSPWLTVAWSNLAAGLMTAGSPARGAKAARHALDLDPSFAAAKYNLGMCHLMMADFAQGFRLHETRFSAGMVPVNPIPGPRWQGERDPNLRLVVHAEQGLGDTLLFARFVQAARARVGWITLVVQPPLVKIFQRLEGADQVIPSGGMLEPYDAQVPLMSLPHVLGVTLDQVPPPPKLWVDPEAFLRFKARLDAMPGLKVGLVWQGNPAFAGDPTRSIKLEALAPLGAVEGITWISLQMGADTARAGLGPPMIDWMSEIQDLSQTAALIDNLDLVVAVDTMLGHLTGALGKKVWIMNRFNTCWRWFQDRDDSPFYPSLRLFRQAAPGSWDQVIDQVQSELRAWAASFR